MSRCIVKQSLSQPVAVAPVAPVAQVSPVSVSSVSVTPVSVSVAVTAAQPVSDASGLFITHSAPTDLDNGIAYILSCSHSYAGREIVCKSVCNVNIESWHYAVDALFPSQNIINYFGDSTYLNNEYKNVFLILFLTALFYVAIS